MRICRMEAHIIRRDVEYDIINYGCVRPETALRLRKSARTDAASHARCDKKFDDGGGPAVVKRKVVEWVNPVIVLD